METTTIPPMPQPADPRFWKSQAKRRRIGLLLADRAAGLLNLQRNQNLNRRLVRKMQDGTLGRPEQQNGQAPEDGDVGDGIHVGDVYQWHNEPQTSETRHVASNGGGGSLAKLLAAALAGAGLAGGTAWLADRGRDDQEPPPVVQPADDDLRYGLEIVRPTEPEDE